MKKTFFAVSFFVLMLSLGCISNVERIPENNTIEEPRSELDLEDCLGLNRVSLRSDCLVALAGLTGNSTPCEFIGPGGDGLARDGCMWGAAVGSGNLSACDSFPSTNIDYTAYSCYSAIAVKAKDISICDRIPEGASKEWCYRGVAIATGRASLCAGDELCLMRVAVARKDSVACSSLPTFRDTCIAEVAAASGDESLCSSVSNSHETDYCYLMVAAAKSDSVVCGRITDNYTKESCFQKARATIRLSLRESYARNDALWRSSDSEQIRRDSNDRCFPLVGALKFRGVVLFEECGKNCLGGCPNTGPGVCYYALRNADGCVAYVQSRLAADGNALKEDIVYRTVNVNDTLEVYGNMSTYHSYYCDIWNGNKTCDYFVIQEDTPHDSVGYWRLMAHG